ncbi:MAG: TIGR04002 family protein [Oscillospiraceae bacterium]|nr:TIGR04002 family protein [Oscillospiraceae bacterium]
MRHTKKLVLAALFAAAIAVCTRFTSIPIFGGMGYVHVGDAFIFLAASVLPVPYAMACAACGGALGDLMSGFVAYMLPTAIIKALMALMFFPSRGTQKLVNRKNLLSAVLAVIVLVGGYYIAEVIMYKSFISPIAGIYWNITQGLFSSAGYFFLAALLDRTNFKERLGA